MTDTLDRIELDGYINDEGKLEVEVPPGFPTGKVRVALEAEKTKDNEATDDPSSDESWTEEEIREALRFEGKTVGEIMESGLIGAWKDSWGDRDPAEWVEEQRRKASERYKW